jgi:hypothetical protein
MVLRVSLFAFIQPCLPSRAERAEEARTLADQMGHDEKSKQTMLRIVADYERMAKHAEERASSRASSRNEE